jgi:hypothetical protein
MERDNSVNGLLPDLDKLSLEKGRPLDVDDLDDEGWLAASEQKKIIELGSLGEGAGGAVTRCKLKDGKTVFALKVFTLSLKREISYTNTIAFPDHHNRPKPRCEEADRSRTQLQQGLCVRAHLPVLRRFHGQVDGNNLNCDGVLRRRKSGQHLQGGQEIGRANRRKSTRQNRRRRLEWFDVPT